jgi:hypothetical protein
MRFISNWSEIFLSKRLSAKIGQKRQRDKTTQAMIVRRELVNARRETGWCANVV